MKFLRTELPDGGEHLMIEDGKGDLRLALGTTFYPEQVTHPNYRSVCAHWMLFARGAMRSFRTTESYRQSQLKIEQTPKNVINLTGEKKKRWVH